MEYRGEEISDSEWLSAEEQYMEDMENEEEKKSGFSSQNPIKEVCINCKYFYEEHDLVVGGFNPTCDDVTRCELHNMKLGIWDIKEIGCNKFKLHNKLKG